MSMFTKLKQFKDLRNQTKDLQDKLGSESITATTAGSKIKLTLDGNLRLATLDIATDLLSPDKKSMLENAIKDAHADALKKMQQRLAVKIKEMGGLPKIPGLN